MQQTIADVRARFGRVEATVATRTADTLQIVQHLKRLVDCVHLSCRDTAVASDVSNVVQAMGRALDKLDSLYGGRDVFRDIYLAGRAAQKAAEGDFGGGDNSNSDLSTHSSTTLDSSLEDGDASSDSEVHRARLHLATKLENRRLKEEILDLKWQLKRARAAPSPKLPLDYKARVISSREEIRALRLRLEEVLASQKKLQAEVQSVSFQQRSPVEAAAGKSYKSAENNNNGGGASHRESPAVAGPTAKSSKSGNPHKNANSTRAPPRFASSSSSSTSLSPLSLHIESSGESAASNLSESLSFELEHNALRTSQVLWSLTHLHCVVCIFCDEFDEGCLKFFL